MEKLLFIVLFIPFFGYSEDGIRELMPTYERTKSEKSADISPGNAVFLFKMTGIDDVQRQRYIDYSIDGKAIRTRLIDNTYLQVETTPGDHTFQFFFSTDYTEITTDHLTIKDQYRDEYTIYFQRTDEIYIVEKPVIYLYPEEQMEVDVSLNVHGELLFTYPAYKHGWHFTAEPSGKLTCDNKQYNYLFWESAKSGNIQFDSESGFIVEGNKAVEFLEDKLTIAGLTSQEQADFITYWGPRLMQNPLNKVRFLFNEECDQFADLTITPTPDHVYRIYMVWQSVENATPLKPQEIPVLERNGFTVVEWGGQELNAVEI